MRSGHSSVAERPAKLARRVVLAVAMAAALAIIGTALLFGNSPVRCAEGGDRETPELRCAFDVGAPPQEVWQAFSRTETPQPHYFDAVLQAELRPGGRWRFVTDDRERLLADGKILEIEPPRGFTQSFAAADLDDPPSRIRVELEPIAGGTRVLLVHDRFAGRTATYHRFRRAHPLALSALKSLLETGRLPLRARLYTAIFKPGMKLATVRAEPWQ